jgi:hypothetical protein
MQAAEFEHQQPRPVAAGHGVLLQQPALLELTQQSRRRALRLAGEPDHVSVADLRLMRGEAAQDFNGIVEGAHGLEQAFRAVPENGTRFLILRPGNEAVNGRMRGIFEQSPLKIRATGQRLLV